LNVAGLEGGGADEEGGQVEGEHTEEGTAMRDQGDGMGVGDNQARK